MLPDDIALRSYQARIVSACVKQNTIVVLPTGSGKTLIAAETIVRVGTPALFLVPTCLLVESQLEAIKDWTNLDVQPYMGRAALPKTFDILVSTPRAFEVAQKSPSARHLQWHALKMVVFDEVHHVLKEHPYRKLALSLRSSGAKPRVQGLTASCSYAVEENKLYITLRQLCSELGVSNMETADEVELRACGYHAHKVVAEVPSLSKPLAPPPGVLPKSERRPHLMVKTFFLRVLHSEATPFSITLSECVLEMEQHMVKIDPHFKSPLQNAKNVKEWGQYAHNRAEDQECVAVTLYTNMEPWYEALRLLVVSWEESDFGAITFLRMCGSHKDEKTALWPQQVQARLIAFWNAAPQSFPRLDQLRDVLLHKYDEIESFRGILFVQQRVSTHILDYFIRSDPELGPLFRPACLYAASSPATPSLAISKTQGMENLKAFGSGKVNILIATSVAEEGMDVPASNCVIRFDAMHHAISMVQGRGRARQEHSSFVVLDERTDRPTSMLEHVESQQNDLIKTFQPSKPTSEDQEKLRIAQRNRERDILPFFKNVSVSPTESLSTLNTIAQKTKTDLKTSYVKGGTSWVCSMEYKSVIRCATAHGFGNTKKSAQHNAGQSLYLMLRKQLSPQ